MLGFRIAAALSLVKKRKHLGFGKGDEHSSQGVNPFLGRPIGCVLVYFFDSVGAPHVENNSVPALI